MSIHSFGARRINLEKADAKNATHWVECENGVVPKGAVEIGTVNLEPVFVGRVTLESSDIIPGTVTLSGKKRVCLISLDGKVTASEKYEVLVNNQRNVFAVQWASLSFDGTLPKHAVKCGLTAGGETLYVARARPPSEVNYKPSSSAYFVCRVREGELKAVMAFNGAEVKVDDFKVLCMVNTQVNK